jgi:hypothetical protein
MNALVFLFFFGVLGAMAAASSPADVLTGDWKNELGSNCTFKADDDGSITGHYDTAVGKVHTQHPLFGQWLQGRKNPGVFIVSFTVMWKDTDEGKPRSGTAWNGELFIVEGGPKLVTTWILVSEKRPEDAWKNTLINKDTFVKQK